MPVPVSVTARTSVLRRLPAVACVALALPATSVAAGPSLPSCASTHWVSGWSAAPGYGVEAGVADATLRMIVRPNTGGSRVRVRLTNRFGSEPVTFSQVRLARRAQGPALVAGTSRPVSFGGQASVTLAPGQDRTSDPLTFDVLVREDLAVSMAVAGDPGQVTAHRVARTTSYLTAEGAGDRTADEAADAFVATTDQWLAVAGIDVEARASVGTVAAVGDSITDGFQGAVTPLTASDADLDTNARWPDFFAARIGETPLAVTSAAISGNRVLRDAFSPGFGPALRARLDPDVLALPGVTDVVLLAGMNDIGQGLPGNAAFPAATAEDLVAAFAQIIERLHARGVRVHLGTLTPAGGTIVPTYGGAEPDARRHRTNAWIRSQGLADSVIDFDAALRDPARPSRLLPAYDSSDHLHPSTAGYRRMASIVDASAFAGGACGTTPTVRAQGRRRGGLLVRVGGVTARRVIVELRKGRTVVARAIGRTRASGTRLTLRPVGRERIAAGRHTLVMRVAGRPDVRRPVRVPPPA